MGLPTSETLHYYDFGLAELNGTLVYNSIFLDTFMTPDEATTILQVSPVCLCL